MADVKISALPAATTPLAGTEVLPIVQSGTTKQVSVANLTDGRTVTASTINVSANTSSSAVLITQTGSGNALLVEDSASTDTSPFIITGAGDVGIGTTSPSKKLVVSDVGAFGIEFSPNDAAQSYNRIFNYNRSTSQYVPVRYEGSTHKFLAGTSGTTAALDIGATGEVYVGGATDQGAYNLQCNGTGVWGAGAYVNGSDARIKDDIADLPDALDKVMSLRPVTFRYKPEYNKDVSIQPGFIAQELQQVFAGEPYINGIVLTGPQYLSVAYQNLIPVLTKAIQQLKTDLDAAKAEITALKGA